MNEDRFLETILSFEKYYIIFLEEYENPHFIISDVIISDIRKSKASGINISYQVRYTSRLDSKFTMVYNKQVNVKNEDLTSFIREQKIKSILDGGCN